MVMQNIGNHSSLSQFSNEGCLLCFLPPSFERALHLCFFPRCAAGGLFGKSQSTLWKSEASSTLLSMVLVLLDAQNRSPEVRKVKDVVLIYRQLKPRRLQRVFFFRKLLTAPPPKGFTVFVQAYKTRGHKRAFQDESWYTITVLFTAS